MFCSNCGTELPDEVNFCPKCGHAVRDRAEHRDERWEVCGIQIGKTGDGRTSRWVARAIGPRGQWDAAESVPFPSDKWAQQPSAFLAIVVQLLGDGWEPMGGAEPRGVPADPTVANMWRFFRRRVRG